jgi:hypothetical protein
VSDSIRIGYEDVPIHWLSSSGGAEHIWFFVYDDEADVGKGSETFVGGEMSRMEGQKVE